MKDADNINIERGFLVWLVGVAMESYCKEGCHPQCPFAERRNSKNKPCEKLTESEALEIFCKMYYGK